jgi:hypothetical protein
MYQNIFLPVQHIRRPEIKPGGYCWLVYTPIENIENWPQIDPATNLAATPITLKAGKTWYEAKVVDKNRFFNEGMRVDEKGHFWEQSITGYIGGNNSNQTLNAAALPFHQYVIMLQDRDGQVRLIGSEDSGATIIEDYSSGDDDASRRWNYRFGWQHVNPSTIYIGDLTGILDDVIEPPFTGQGDFNNDFNPDFDL